MDSSRQACRSEAARNRAGRRSAERSASASTDTVTAAATATATPAPTRRQQSGVRGAMSAGRPHTSPAGSAYPGRVTPIARRASAVSCATSATPLGCDTAVRAERGIRHDVVAVRAQHLLHPDSSRHAFRAVARSARQFSRPAMQKPRRAGAARHEVHSRPGRLQSTRARTKGTAPQGQLNASSTAVGRSLARGTGEPQCHADQAARGRGGQWRGHTLDSRLGEKSADRSVRSRRARGELGSQPCQRRRGGERDRAQCTDHEPVQRLSGRRAAAAAPQPRGAASGPRCLLGWATPRASSGPSEVHVAQRDVVGVRRRCRRSAVPSRHRARDPALRSARAS